MKKLPLLLLAIFVFTGCTLTPQTQPTPQDTWTTLTDTIPYSWALIVAWVGPDESFEQTIAADTLALKQTFEDHSDHVFIDRQSWSNYSTSTTKLGTKVTKILDWMYNIVNHKKDSKSKKDLLYLDIQDDLVPWNIVNFVGAVKALDAAAGNHYYQVATIDELTKIWTPSQADVEELIQRYGFCETENDCIGIYGQCPLSCQLAINIKYQTTVEKIISNFRNAQTPQCTYKCMEIKKVGCSSEYKCVIE